MGGGTPKNKSNQNRAATSQINRLVQTEVGGSGADNIGGRLPKNVCLLNFSTKFSTNKVVDVLGVGSEIFFVPREEPGKLNLELGSERLGVYTGVNAQIMYDCASQGFEYVGTVTEVILRAQGALVTVNVTASIRE